jgi:glycosyltransferase involved in cell wall biosynthesis
VPDVAKPADDLFLSVVIPVYNEIATLEKVVGRVAAVPIRKEIILVDDGSTDGSRELLDRLAAAHPGVVRPFKHEHNKGKGAALKTGFGQARGDVVLIQDADLEYDPADYPKLLRPIREAGADVVYGSRFLVGDYARVHLFWHYMGNRFLTFLSNVFTGLNLTDMETCYKVFRREVVQKIDIKSRRFTIEPELTAKIARQRVRIFEVPISYAGRNYGEGKKITWKDGLAALWAIVRYRFAD